MQIWHGGRAVHPDFIGGKTPVSSSAIAIPDSVHTAEGRKPHVVPHELTVDEVKEVVQ